MPVLPGVCVAYHKDKSIYYRASVTVKNKHISLGSFDSAEEASKAYRQALEIINSPAQDFQISDYNSTVHALPFDKWVVLINLRDNGIYMANPIYIRPNFFYYYFSVDEFFIFSTEDLFYYSAHRIQRRGGHYFVADYGSQINIMTRYNIMSHAVCGRDYFFKNGNRQDMQYSNIEVINTYHGVSLDITGPRPVYRVRIHVNGYINVGSYDDPVSAAIAYNKAADTLKAAGMDRLYATNYIDGLSPKSYADLYTTVKISDRILSFNGLNNPQNR